MHQVLKTFFLAACLLVAAFFANYFGYVSIPWLEINAVPTYGGEAKVDGRGCQTGTRSRKSRQFK